MSGLLEEEIPNLELIIFANVKDLYQHWANVKLGGGFKYFFMFIPIWENDPIWLIFFTPVETTN